MLKALKKYIRKSKLVAWLMQTHVGYKKKIPLWLLLKIFFKRLFEHDITDRASAVTFNLVLSIFPFILFLFTLLPYVPVPNLKEEVMRLLAQTIPYGVYTFVANTIEDILSKPRTGLLSFGFILALYAATNGMVSLIDSFNNYYKFAIKRTFLKKRLTAILLTVVIAFILFFVIGIGIIGEIVLDSLLKHHILNDNFFYYTVLSLKYLILFLVFLLGISFIYYVAPAHAKKWRFFSLGSIFATILAVLNIKGFAFYLDNFATYNKVYGSIGTLIAMMMWVYIMAIVLIIGFEINASIDEATYELSHENK